MAKLLELATIQLGKTPEQKALDGLARKVADAKMQFTLDLHNATKAMNNAQDKLSSLDSDVSAGAKDILDARDAYTNAKADVDAITAIIAERF